MAPAYHSSGHGFLVCPRLLEIDNRHGRHWSKHPDCAHGRPCLVEHEHESPIPSGQGHRVNDFYWMPGSRPPTAGEIPACACGQALVYVDLDDPHDPKHLISESAPDLG